MKPLYLKTVLVLLLALVAGGVVYFVERRIVLAEAASTFDSRVQLVDRYMDMMRHNVEVMEHLFERHEDFSFASPRAVRALNAIRHFPEHDTWGVSGLAAEGGLAELNGSLTGTDALQDPSPALRRELTAAFHLDHQFGTLLANVPETVWVYYTSARGFIHIAPDPPVAELRFSEVMYTKPFWTEAVPEHNPAGRQIISELYDDYFERGLMVSISSPVELDGEFVGVMSVDVGIDVLRELTGIGRAVGESILVDEDDRVVARAGEFDVGERYRAAPADEGTDIRLQSLIHAEDVVTDELRLVHRVPRTALAAETAWRSLPAWIVLAALAALLLVSLRLYEAFGQVRYAMRHNTLTGLLNRRGFYTDAAEVRRQARHDHERTALVLFDVDRFKRVNDEHGHDVGDEVLKTIARRLMTGVGEHDRVCRWGGEEILVLLQHAPEHPALPIAERLRRAIESEPVTDREIHVTVSGGLTEWRPDEPLDVAVKRADEQLYRAKNAGRNRIATDLPAERDGD